MAGRALDRRVHPGRLAAELLGDIDLAVGRPLVHVVSPGPQRRADPSAGDRADPGADQEAAMRRREQAVVDADESTGRDRTIGLGAGGDPQMSVAVE